MKSKFLATFLAALFTLSASAATHKTSKPRTTTHHAAAAISSRSKSVHVRGYTRKNGTRVRAYNRSPPTKGKKK